ncbi:zinc-dependent alcohol dehydrogenase family protein [Paraburkholderia dinghuensis]|nr:zinc-dependent alcohol dehydrogenase family protein [Paraburkholderia dinghuensis]
MKQIRIDRFGVPAQVARCCDVADPGEPSPWEVLIDIEVSTISPADLSRLSGRYGELPRLPATAGLEGVGRIVSRGAQVNGLEVGDRVIVKANGNWCQRQRIPATLALKVPADLDVFQLATLKVNACTALELVRRQVPLKRGDWLVQTAPLSGVGRAVMQVARHYGVRTLNIVRRASAIDEVLEAGGDAAIEDGADMMQAALEIVGHAPMPLAIDAVGGEGVSRLAGLLAPGGTVINYGMLSGQPISIGCDQTIFHNISVKGFWLAQKMLYMSRAESDALILDAVDLLSKGVLHAEIAGTYSLDEIGKAIGRAEEAGRHGKVCLLPNGPIARAQPGSQMAQPAMVQLQ